MALEQPELVDRSYEPLPLLAEPESYVAGGLDLGVDADRRGYWLGLFRGHFPSLLEESVLEAEDRGADIDDTRHRGEAAKAAFYGYLDELEEQPNRYGRLDILAICLERERVLRRFGFDDPYRLAKSSENKSALALLPRVLDELDKLDGQALAVRLIEGVFAGNIFDLGVSSTLELFKSGGIDFHATRTRLKPRPWLVDDLDRWVGRITGDRAYRCALLFVDNAGCDIVLGMIPFARYLLSKGIGVVMTANTHPSLNDIIYDELEVLIGGVAEWDEPIRSALEDGRFELVPSGNGAPLIDLAKCSPRLVEAVNRRGVDLMVLEGMGRALETNFGTTFKCDCMKIAMIKDPGVADVYQGEVFDLVLRFEEVV